MSRKVAAADFDSAVVICRHLLMISLMDIFGAAGRPGPPRGARAFYRRRSMKVGFVAASEARPLMPARQAEEGAMSRARPRKKACYGATP